MKKIKLMSAAFCLIAASLLMLGSNYASLTVKDQLSAQKISFPDKATLEKDNSKLVSFADKAVDTGDEAKAYSDYIKGHLAKVADGKTYSEVSGEFQKDRTNKTLEAQRTNLFMGETLRGLLLNAWGWGLVGKIALWASYAVFIVSVGLLVWAVADSGTRKSLPAHTAAKRKAKK